jgi:hypothetical protein
MFFLCIDSILAQKVTISGYVLDELTDEKIIGAIINANNNAVSTNEFGFFSISIDTSQTKKISVKYIGYAEKILTINGKTSFYNISLQSKTNIATIYVYGNRRNLDNYSFSIDEIKKLPSLTGEKDIIKSLQLMPGVQFGNEGTSDLYVRGGTPDQNLILLDDMPMHFVSHLGSFVSIFDINSINSIKLYKNGFPAKYGSNLSSILDIRMKDGNMNKFEGDFTLGLIASKISLNGPIVKNKISFVFTFRRSNFDPLSWAIYKLFPENETFVNYKFYDISAKVNFKISNKDKIDISFYNGADYNKMKIFNSDISTVLANYNTSFKIDYTNSWGNYLNSIRWTHVYNSQLFQKLILGFSSFQYSKSQEMESTDKNSGNVVGYGSSDYLTKIQDFVLKIDYDYFINPINYLNFGLSSTYHVYNPGEFSSILWTITESDTIYASKKETILEPWEYDLYADYYFNTEKFDFNLGFHGNLYFINNKTWYNLQPRAKIQYKPTANNNITLSYDKTYQNLHILTMSSSIVPADIWVPATEKAQPESANQFSLGLSHSFSQKYELSISGFYKTINNLIDYKRYFYITDTINNPTWENQIVTNGKGNIYGIEFLAEKKSGNLTGWISYTYMKNFRHFDDLNNGEPFAFNYDRRHNLQLVAQYNFNKNLSLNAVFMFGSGYPLSLSVIKQNIVEIIDVDDNINSPGTVVNEGVIYSSHINFDGSTYVFNKINTYRMPAYHRLDISLNWEKQKKHGIRTWSFSIYNVYNQQNAYFLFLARETPKLPKPNVEYPLALYKFTLFPIIPTVSYSFKF